MNNTSRVLWVATLAVLMASPAFARRRFSPPPANSGDYQTAVRGRLVTIETTTDEDGNETRSLNRAALSGETVITLGEDDVAIADFSLSDESGDTTVDVAILDCVRRGNFFRCTGTATVGDTVINVRILGAARTSRRTGVTTIGVSIFGVNRDAPAAIGAAGRGTLIEEEDDGDGTP